MIIYKSLPCETCKLERKFRSNPTTSKVYNYKPICKKCMLTTRNKTQNFSPRKHPVNNYFEKIDSEILAYLYGFLWADASIKYTGKSKTISLSLHPKDKEIIDYFLTFIGGTSKIYNIHDKRSNTYYDRLYWGIYSNTLVTNIVNLNFRKDSDAIPDLYFSHFLRGLIDGDGCFYRRNTSVEIKITSSIHQDWSFLSSRIDFPFSIYTKRSDTYKFTDFYFLGNKKILLKYIYNNANFYLKRKYNIIKDLIN